MRETSGAPFANTRGRGRTVLPLGTVLPLWQRYCRRISTALPLVNTLESTDLPDTQRRSIHRHNNNCVPVVYKMPSGTISRMSQMCVSRQIFVIWAPAVDDASGRYRIWCSLPNVKINTVLWPSRGTPLKTAYCRLCIAIFTIFAQRHTYVWHVLKCYCCDLMATVTSAATQKSATVKLLLRRAFYPTWSDDDPFDSLGNVEFWYRQ